MMWEVGVPSFVIVTKVQHLLDVISLCYHSARMFVESSQTLSLRTRHGRSCRVGNIGPGVNSI